jgi:hypothetical protein
LCDADALMATASEILDEIKSLDRRRDTLLDQLQTVLAAPPTTGWPPRADELTTPSRQ